MNVQKLPGLGTIVAALGHVYIVVGYDNSAPARRIRTEDRDQDGHRTTAVLGSFEVLS